MFSFKLFKRKCLIRLMTVLGFGGMVGFCIASCQSPKANENQQPKQESPENINPVQAEIQPETQADNPSPTNPDTQVVQETIENTDTVQTETMSFEQMDDEQQIPECIPNDINKACDPDYKRFAKEYGTPPTKLGVPPTKPGGVSRDEVRQFMIKMTQKIQSTCHPESGKLVVTFTIQKSGKIVNVKSTDGTLKGTKSEKCILEQISKHRFRKFERVELPVKYPFEFK